MGTEKAAEGASLWERMGGEAVIRPMVADIYKLHTTDPLTANWFGPHKFSNTGSSEHVIQKVFEFFSAGIGGPYEYTGKDMIETHKGMKISDVAFHALSTHVLTKMKEHGAGGDAELAEVL